MRPEARPTGCDVCGAPLPLREEPRGRPRRYCGSICKERARRRAALDRLVEASEAKGREDMAERIRNRITVNRARWRAAV
jgi:hypothetical protein